MAMTDLDMRNLLVTMIETVRYAIDDEDDWNAFQVESRNSMFMFNRKYMDYHSDRFDDHSLIFLNEKGNIEGLFPSNVHGMDLISHGGLTFGGVISHEKMTTPMMLEIFTSLVEFAKKQGIGRISYKVIPYIYHKNPAGEELYGLFRNKAKLVRRDVSSSINLNEKLSFSKERRWCIRKSERAGFEVKRSYDFTSFMEIERSLLVKKYGVEPTHSPEEMNLLALNFPENIKLFATFHQGDMVGGIVIYEYETLVHAQYIAATDFGKEHCAIDAIIHHLVSEQYSSKNYFDFGISTEKDGMHLNPGLIKYKRSFGAMPVMYDTYEIQI